MKLADPSHDQMVVESLECLGYSSSDCARLLSGVSEAPETHLPVRSLKENVRRSGLELPGDVFERGLLGYAARETAPQIEKLPIYAPVKALLRREFAFYASSNGEPGVAIEVGTYPFVVAAKIISLRRFPSGPMDWEISGFPRSWLLRVKRVDLPRVLAFLCFRMGGFAPLFFMHVARKPKNRSLIIEREVLRSYYRMARSLELHPTMKGILTSSWFFDPEALQRYPHLRWLNQPYLEAGGLITVAGPAPVESGFAECDLNRKKQFEKGELSFRMGIAIWPRRAAIEWASRHSELEI